MKLYIVTTSLNIDNILSTESILPQEQYAHRNFGYKRFDSILGQILPQNVTLLFPFVPFYSINDNEMESHPMLVELDDEEKIREKYIVAKHEGKEIWATKTPIYLDPANCSILFFSERARILSLQSISDSKLCKWGSYYKTRIATPSNIRLDSVLKDVQVNMCTIPLSDEENIRDRVKGFIYGYYIGKKKILPVNLAKLLAIQKRVYDIVAATKNNASNAFETELKELDDKYNNQDPTIQNAKNLWEHFLDDNAKEYSVSKEIINKILKRFNVEVTAKKQFLKDKGLSLRNIYNNNINLLDYYKEMESHTKKLISEIKTTRAEEEDYSFSKGNTSILLSSKQKEDELFNKVLCNLLWKGVFENCENLQTKRYEIACNAIRGIKKVIEDSGDTWIGSKEQLYFDHLRRNIDDFEHSFDPLESSNTVFQAIAAFILKGEDYEELKKYIEAKAIVGHNYTYALWGATNGYVQISRGIINAELTQEERVDLYKLTYKILNGKDYQGDLVEPSFSPPTVIEQKKIENERDNNTEQDNSDIRNNSENKAFRCSILSAFKSIKIYTKREEKSKDLEQALIQYDGSLNIFDFLNFLLERFKSWQTPTGKESTDFKKLREKLNPEAKQAQTSKANEGTIVFENEDQTSRGSQTDASKVSKFFFNDPNAWNHIKDLVPTESQDKIREDLEWFQNEMQKTPELRQYYNDIVTTNNTPVIEKFCDLKRRNNNAPYFTEELRARIKEKLLKIYATN